MVRTQNHLQRSSLLIDLTTCASTAQSQSSSASHTPDFLYNDYLDSPHHAKSQAISDEISSIKYDDSFADRRIEATFVGLAKKDFLRCVQPAMLCSKRCGNTYTASLYSGLCSLIASTTPVELQGKTIGMFNCGSGLASTMFSIKVVGDTSEMKRHLDLQQRLEESIVLSPTDYETALHHREAIHQKRDVDGQGGIEHMLPGPYFLKDIGVGWRRTYGTVL